MASSDYIIIDFSTDEVVYQPAAATFDSIPPTMTWLEQAKQMPPPGWAQLFQDCLPTFYHIYQLMQKKKLIPYFPLDRDVFAAYWFTPANTVRVVIFGQDPYHDTDYEGYPSGTGMAFSLKRGNPKINPSLRVIQTSLQECYPGWTPKHGGCLKHWAEQGVLLLNQCLTVSPGVPGSHGNIWQHFIFKTIEWVNETNPFTIFVLWGKKAQDNLTEFIKARDESFIITAPHPSPINQTSSRLFRESKQFLKINDKLTEIGQKPVEW